MKPTRTIDDIVRYCMEYQKKTGRILRYGYAVAMIEREERIARENKKKASAKRRQRKDGQANERTSDDR